MEQTLSANALSMIDRYIHFRFGSAVCSVPYFNNKTVRARAALRATIGKGSPQDILSELESVAVKLHADRDALADETLKKILADSGLGVDCSAFAFYVLAAEAEARGYGKLERHIHFVNCTGLVGKVRCSLRPVENCDVATLADDRNSRIVTLDGVQPGDFISMLNDGEEKERDHILVVDRVGYEGAARPAKIHYSHAVAYPEDGVYGTGVRQGVIELNSAQGGAGSDTGSVTGSGDVSGAGSGAADHARSLTEALWSENGSVKGAERLFERAKKSKTEIRRLNLFEDNKDNK
ncbi:MAG: hypothetical protein KGI45_02380 [Patescibacteria group bacterium]|nr:hypothetical protein [Patescibacteria group bacterium]MDE1966898.1 hypothetical protein [Patescibacteria group bacterium]